MKLHHPKVHPPTKFGIPISNNTRNICSRHKYSKNLVKGKGHSDSKMVRDTHPARDAFTHQIWDSYLKEYRRYALDTKKDVWNHGRTV